MDNTTDHLEPLNPSLPRIAPPDPTESHNHSAGFTRMDAEVFPSQRALEVNNRIYAAMKTKQCIAHAVFRYLCRMQVSTFVCLQICNIEGIDPLQPTTGTNQIGLCVYWALGGPGQGGAGAKAGE
jgi:hypothetical protein